MLNEVFLFLTIKTISLDSFLFWFWGISQINYRIIIKSSPKWPLEFQIAPGATLYLERLGHMLI